MPQDLQQIKGYIPALKNTTIIETADCDITQDVLTRVVPTVA